MIPSVNVPNDPVDSITFQEWKECRTTIARCDEIILNLRKYGFSLITLLIGAQGVIYASLRSEGEFDNGILIGIYLTIMLLIFGLFRLDRMYHIFLRAAVIRAREIEEKTSELNLSTVISELTHRRKTARWGTSFYLLFCFANYVLVSGTLLNFKTIADLNLAYMMNRFAFLVCSAILVLTLAAITYFHYRSSRTAYNEEIDNK